MVILTVALYTSRLYNTLVHHSFGVASSLVQYIASTCSINKYKLGDVGISRGLIGSLSLANGQCPPPGRWIMKQWPA